MTPTQAESLLESENQVYRTESKTAIAIMKFTNAAAALASLAVVCGASTAAHAGSLINFESVSGAGDNLNLSGMQFETDFGHVTFGIDNDRDGIADTGKSAFLEEVGGTRDDKAGFVTDVHDTGVSGKVYDLDTDPNSDLGRYFLRTAGLDGDGGALLITYGGEGGGMTAAAQGEIWDIDGTSATKTEQWLVEALGSDLTVIDSVTSPLGSTNGADSLDGKAWTWSFDREQNDIQAIRISFVGGKNPGSIGLAFDNFRADHIEDAEDVPEPASLLGVLAVGGALLAKRRKDINA